MDCKVGYECGACSEVYNTHYEAQECCQPVINDLLICGVCGTEYSMDNQEDEAENCCSDKDPLADEKRYKINQIEAEKAGQERLF